MASSVSAIRLLKELLVEPHEFQISLEHVLMRLSASARSCADLMRSFCDRWQLRLLFSAHESGEVSLQGKSSVSSAAPIIYPIESIFRRPLRVVVFLDAAVVVDATGEVVELVCDRVDAQSALLALHI